MKNNKTILAALDALTIAVNANTRERQETLEQRYGPKPEPVTHCEQALYSHAQKHENMVHRCKLSTEHAGAHTTSMYGTPINWYGK